MPMYRTYWTCKRLMLDWRQRPAHIHVTLDAENELLARVAAETLARPLMGGVEGDYDCLGTWSMPDVPDDDPPDVVSLDEDGEPWRGPRARTLYDPPTGIFTATPASGRIRGMVCRHCHERDTCEVRGIEHPVWVSTDVVLVHVQAAICRSCGMATFDTATDALVSAAHERLVMGKVAGWQAIGTVYRAS